jgi:hypothetical protein
VSGQRIRPTTDHDGEERMARIDRDDAESPRGATATGQAVPGRDRRTGDSGDILPSEFLVYC